MATDSHDPDPVQLFLTGTWPTDDKGQYIIRDDAYEEDFELVLKIKLRGHGTWYRHGLGMFRRLQRELELIFGEGSAELEWESPRPGATANLGGPESSATGGPGNGDAPAAE